ncbi:MAG: tetratricopeptide repeat protein [Thermoanaerobaculaceae bacterium]
MRTNIGQARRLMSQNDFGPAAELLDQAVRLMPDPETLLLLAQVEFRNPMWAQRALDRLRHAVSLNPKFTKGWLELANYWGMRGQADRQKQCLEKVLSYDPANKDARAALNAIIEAQPKRRFF